MKKGPTPQPILGRFLEKISPEPNSGCWLWDVRGGPNGYGQFYINRYPYPAHRVAWTLFRGPIPDGQFVLHKCDIRPCVNPDHLFLGTQLDNMRDMTEKGRHHYLKRTHCRSGHPYSTSNFYLSTEGGRVCRTCDRARGREKYARKMAAGTTHGAATKCAAGGPMETGTTTAQEHST